MKFQKSKIILLLTALFLLCVASINAQKKTTPKTQKKTNVATTVPKEELKKMARGKVQEIIETNTVRGKSTTSIFRYNEQGQLVCMLLSRYGGNNTIKIDFEYNEDGKMSKRSILGNKEDADQTPSEIDNELNIISICELPSGKEENIPFDSGSQIDTYVYENGKLIKETTISKSEHSSHQSEREYHTNGKLRKSIWNDGHGNITTYTYDQRGNLLSKKENGQNVSDDDDDDHEGCGEGNKKYDTLGRLTQDISDCQSNIYKYNTYNFLTYNLNSSRWTEDKVTTYVGYRYDSNHNWTQRTINVTGGYIGKAGLKITATRKISYYN